MFLGAEDPSYSTRLCWTHVSGTQDSYLDVPPLNNCESDVRPGLVVTNGRGDQVNSQIWNLNDEDWP